MNPLLFRVTAALLLAACGLFGGGACKSTGTKDGEKRTRYVDPELERLESKMKLVPKFDDKGVSTDRSSFERQEFNNFDAFSTDSFDAQRVAKEGFDGTGRFDTETLDRAAEMESPVFETSESSDSKKGLFFWRKKNKVPQGRFDTGPDALNVTEQGFATGADRIVNRRRGSYPEPDIVSSGADPVSVEQVRELLDKNQLKASATVLPEPAPAPAR